MPLICSTVCLGDGENCEFSLSSTEFALLPYNLAKLPERYQQWRDPANRPVNIPDRIFDQVVILCRKVPP